MTLQQVIAADLQVDLRPFSQALWQRGIPHRIHEQAGKQILTVEGTELAAHVGGLYREFEEGVLVQAPVSQTVAPAQANIDWRRWLQSAPVTLVLILLCVLGAAVVSLHLVRLQNGLTFIPLLNGGLSSGSLADVFSSGQWWRLWTPMFLHFGAIHLVFNSLWLWEFGRRIELLQGHRRLLLLVVVIGLGSNMAQYLATGPVLFGGMSGVVCGLVGYCWGWSLMRPGQDFGMPKTLYVVFVGMILAMWALGGALTRFGFPAVADAAHIGGFIVGWCIGVILGRISASTNTQY